MADETKRRDGRESRRSRDDRRDGTSPNGERPRKRTDDRPRKRKRPSAGKAAAAARREIEELMGRSPEAVSGVERDEDGWLVTIEFVELERIPQSTDVMATYEVSLDEQGELTGYRRTRRYVRSQAEG
jgi:Gas vesicle synthesis protein GvpO